MTKAWMLPLVGLALLFPGVAANHSQPVSGVGDVVFDHRTGNEWWVEVDLFGSAAGSVSRVEAMDTGGPWVTLTKRSWGPYANSFHIEPGHTVKFRGTWPNGAQAESCWFTHPAGVEQCGTQPGAFDASFSQVSGNNWWVQVKVTGNKGIAGVDARYGCGFWRPLVLQSWGSWAASFPLPSGEKVDFRARSTTGEYDRSGGYLWTSATPTSGCPVEPKQSPAWATSHIHDGDPIAGVQDTAIGVVSGWYDQPALYFATFNGMYWSFYWNGGWTTEYLNGLQGMSLAIGDAERDGDAEIYVGSTDGQIYMLVPSGPGGLQPLAVARVATSGTAIRTLTVGDADRDGLTELYAASESGDVFRIWRSSVSGEFQTVQLGRTGVMAFSSWIGDGDRDGDIELYVGGLGGVVSRVEKTSTSWSVTKLMELCCDFVTRVGGLAAGDGNGDGKTEVYAAVADGLLRKVTWTGAAWVRETIATFEAPLTDLTLADVNGDGKQELYVTAGWNDETRSSDVWRVEWTGSAWSKTLLGRVSDDYELFTVVAGDADANGSRELYAGSSGGDVYQVRGSFVVP